MDMTRAQARRTQRRDARPGWLTSIGSSLVKAFGVVLDGVRLLVAHWPVLLVLYLLGAAGREAALYAAFEISRFSPLLSALVLALAPLASLTALILMLRHLMPSLRHVDGEVSDTIGTRLSVVAAALIPFLGVYAAQGFLREDTRRYLNEVVNDEYAQTNFLIGEQMGDRTIADLDVWVLAVTVFLALVLRSAMDRWQLPSKHTAWGFFAAWVEAVWVVFAAKSLSSLIGQGRSWVTNRIWVEWVLDGWATVMGWIGPVGTAVNGAIAWLWGVLGDFDSLVVVPLAWLTIGAVVYGRQIEVADSGPELDLHVRSDRIARRLKRARQMREQVERRSRWEHLPPWLRTWVTGPIAGVRTRFQGLGKGLMTLVRAGLLPMVVLCLVFLLARQAAVWVAYVVRWIIGPQSANLMVALSTYVDILLRATSTVLIVVLIAAAVDRFLVHPDGAAAQEEEPAPEGEPAPEQG